MLAKSEMSLNSCALPKMSTTEIPNLFDCRKLPALPKNIHYRQCGYRVSAESICFPTMNYIIKI